MSLPLSTTAPGDGAGTTIADPLLWSLTVGAVLLLLALDFLITRRPHEVSMREAIGWSVIYVALPLAFGVWVWSTHGSQTGLEYYTGYLVEKSLSVDNLFVFIIILTAFAVPRVPAAAGAAHRDRGCADPAGGVHRAGCGPHHPLLGDLSGFRAHPSGHRLEGPPRHPEGRPPRRRRDAAGVVFAIDSVPAVYGITGDPYLVFVTNAFALLGLRALHFVLEGALGRLRHLGYGLSVILAFIGVKLVLHWAHDVWEGVPTVPTLASLIVILSILSVTVTTSLLADRSRPVAPGEDRHMSDVSHGSDVSRDRPREASDRPG